MNKEELLKLKETIKDQIDLMFENCEEKEEKFSIEKMYEDLFENKETWYEDPYGKIESVKLVVGRRYADLNNCLSETEVKQEQARRILRNYSAWKTGGEYRGFVYDKPNYCFCYDHEAKTIERRVFSHINWGETYFETLDHVEQALNDLGEKLIKESLGIFED